MEPAEGPSWSGRWVWCTDMTFWQGKVIYLHVGRRDGNKWSLTEVSASDVILQSSSQIPQIERKHLLPDCWAALWDMRTICRWCSEQKTRTRHWASGSVFLLEETDTVLGERSHFCVDCFFWAQSPKVGPITVRKGGSQLTFDMINLQNAFSPPAELRWTRRSSSVEPSLSATAPVTSLPAAATAIRIVVYVWSLQYTFNKTRSNREHQRWRGGSSLD